MDSSAWIVHGTLLCSCASSTGIHSLRPSSEYCKVKQKPRVCLQQPYALCTLDDTYNSSPDIDSNTAGAFETPVQLHSSSSRALPVLSEETAPQEAFPGKQEIRKRFILKLVWNTPFCPIYSLGRYDIPVSYSYESQFLIQYCCIIVLNANIASSQADYYAIRFRTCDFYFSN